MARKKAKALPPKMITVYAEILQETEKAILVRCDEDADGEWLPKSQIKYAGERGDTNVEIEIPELLADEKGFFDGMGRAEVKASPVPAEPAQPETATFFGVRNFDEDTENDIYFEVHYNDGEGTVVEFFIPKAHIISEGKDSDYPEEDERRYIEISVAHAIEAGIMEAPEEGRAGPDVVVSESAPEAPAGKRAFDDNVKWLKEEKITVTQPLSDTEKARYAEEMAALDKEIEELEDERSDVSSRLKKQIDAKEQERREMSAHVNDGELRTISCDCLKDYNTEEMVWTEAYPPYNEVQRRKMTKEEMQPTLLEYSEKMAASAPAEEGAEPVGTAPEGEGVDFDAMADAEGAESDALEDAAAESEGDAPGCTSCAHQDSGDDESCDGCGDAHNNYTPIAAATEQGQGAGAVQ